MNPGETKLYEYPLPQGIEHDEGETIEHAHSRILKVNNPEFRMLKDWLEECDAIKKGEIDILLILHGYTYI